MRCRMGGRAYHCNSEVCCRIPHSRRCSCGAKARAALCVLHSGAALAVSCRLVGAKDRVQHPTCKGRHCGCITRCDLQRREDVFGSYPAYLVAQDREVFEPPVQVAPVHSNPTPLLVVVVRSRALPSLNASMGQKELWYTRNPPKSRVPGFCLRFGHSLHLRSASAVSEKAPSER